MVISRGGGNIHICAILLNGLHKTLHTTIINVNAFFLLAPQLEFPRPTP